MVNFDNSATSFPKPASVRSAVILAMVRYGGNPGRSGHKLSLDTAYAVYRARRTAAEFFDADADSTVFTMNCTHALNIVIKGVVSDGGHIIISDLEHNSVARPVYAMSERGCTYSIAHISHDDAATVKNFEKLITRNTQAVVCTLGSNVTGRITPYREIGAMCKKHGICFIADGAQACGVIPIKMNDGINILCTAGHKALYGLTGTGLLMTDGSCKIKSLMQGGTGSTSLELSQPDFLPDGLESGTPNTAGIISLGEGIRFVSHYGTENIFRHESKLCRKLIDALEAIEGTTVYRDDRVRAYLPVVSFNIAGMTANEAAAELSRYGYALRGGLHCAGLAHKALGTAPEGTVRFSPSVFSSEAEVDGLISVIRKLAQGAEKRCAP